MKKICSSLIVVIVFLTSLCYAKLAPTTLEEVIKYSDYIVIGQVSQVFYLQGIQIAEVDVKETLKGDKKKKLYYLVKCKFVCDEGEAKEGEVALFFFWEGVNPFFEATKDFTDELNKITNGASLLNITRYGEGRMPIKLVLDKLLFYVTFSIDGIRLPKNITPLPSKNKYEYYRLVPLIDMIRFIRLKIDEEKQEKLKAHLKL